MRLLRGAELGPAYEHAFLEWEHSGEAAAWEVTAGDGLKADAAGHCVAPRGSSGDQRGEGWLGCEPGAATN